MKPEVHAEATAVRLGGKPEDYLDIHELLDSSREAFADTRHRTLTHNSWFISEIIPRIFGSARVNSDGTKYSVIDVAEHHVLEDFRTFIPSAADFLREVEYKDWMNNGEGEPPADAKKLVKWQKARAEASPPAVTPPPQLELDEIIDVDDDGVLDDGGQMMDREEPLERPYRRKGGCGGPGVMD